MIIKHKFNIFLKHKAKKKKKNNDKFLKTKQNDV